MLSVLRKLKSKLAKRLYSGSYPPGHYYSPLPDMNYIKKNQDKIFSQNVLRDIDLNTNWQFQFLEKSIESYKDYFFKSNQESGLRYFYDNTFFNRTDSLALFFILNYFKPKRIIEVGSGFSSACILDIFDRHLKYKPEMLFIEPYPDRLRSLLNGEDLNFYKLSESIVQNVDSAIFEQLGENDLLFIDSSHVSKVGSDLNHLLFEVLPRLKKGVIIHFHDICYPFEYPREWVLDGIYWNEIYMLRAFLMNNNDYEILLFNSFVSVEYKDWLATNMPAFESGGSFYLRKR